MMSESVLGDLYFRIFSKYESYRLKDGGWANITGLLIRKSKNSWSSKISFGSSLLYIFKLGESVGNKERAVFNRFLLRWKLKMIMIDGHLNMTEI